MQLLELYTDYCTVHETVPYTEYRTVVFQECTYNNYSAQTSYSLLYSVARSWKEGGMAQVRPGYT